MDTNNKNSIVMHIIGLTVCLMLASIFIGKIISTSITYSLDNPYNFEETNAEIVRIKKYDSIHGNMDWYGLIAQYNDVESGITYVIPLPYQYSSEEEASTHIGRTVSILIDRKYQKAILKTSGSKANGAELIVFSVLLVVSLAISIYCIITIVRKNKKHWIWIGLYCLIMLGLITIVSYSSLDINYIDQLKTK